MLRLSSLFRLLLCLGVAAEAPRAYFTMTVFASTHPQLDDKILNAYNTSFVIGVDKPTTYCGLGDPSQCPRGDRTLINADITLLASSVPGGQFIYVAPDGSISYSSAHSTFRPPGSQVGGFFPTQVASSCHVPATVLTWLSLEGAPGLWACPLAPGIPLSVRAKLKATAPGFVGKECVVIDGIRLTYEGDAFGAWAYT